MVARVRTVAFHGVEVIDVDTQVTIASGLPAFNVVGLPDKAVAESRERVRAALAALGLALPPRHITVNLAPADVAKEGSHFDLPIALGLLAEMAVLPQDELAGYTALGEVSLDGSLTRVPGVLLAALAAAARDSGIICPLDCGGEAAWAGDVEIIAAPNLLAIVNHFKGTQLLPPPEAKLAPSRAAGLDLKDVKGQESAKRALEIAASGGHNLLMVGPPGSGKSTLAALVGGGLRVRPGEISLAHQGVLFLDELPEFSRSALEALRQPLETGHISVARANSHVTYPARVQLVAAMNPCRCGYLAEPGRACGRAPRCAQDYQARLSGPLLDRIDLYIDVPAVASADLALPPPAETSAAIGRRVAAARARQSRRYATLPPEQRIRTNAEADGALLDEIATPEPAGLALLQRAAERLRLSARGYHRVLRVARTLADLEGAAAVARHHIAEALSYRMPLNVADGAAGR